MLSPTDLVAIVKAVADTSRELAGRLRLQLPDASSLLTGGPAHGLAIRWLATGPE